MSDIPPPEVVEQLTAAISQLSLVVHHLSQPASSSHQEPVAACVATHEEWEVVDPPAPVSSGRVFPRRSPPARLEELSCPELPEAAKSIAVRKLSGASIGAIPRAERAFQAGFRARKCIAERKEYRSLSPLIDLSVVHHVVLRSSRDSPFRVTSRADLRKLIEVDQNTIVESFPSLTEVQLFCLGADCAVPDLVKCSYLRK